MNGIHIEGEEIVESTENHYLVKGGGVTMFEYFTNFEATFLKTVFQRIILSSRTLEL